MNICAGSGTRCASPRARGIAIAGVWMVGGRVVDSGRTGMHVSPLEEHDETIISCLCRRRLGRRFVHARTRAIIPFAAALVQRNGFAPSTCVTDSRWRYPEQPERSAADRPPVAVGIAARAPSRTPLAFSETERLGQAASLTERLRQRQPAPALTPLRDPRRKGLAIRGSLFHGP